MCGIVGYVGSGAAQEILLGGLRRLEYRGYDSAGISVLVGDRIESVRAVGNLDALEAKLDDQRSRLGGQRRAGAGHRDPLNAHSPTGASGAPVAIAEDGARTGIGHTRWATHGRVSEENAHPHFDSLDRVHVVVNGIVENYLELKRELEGQGWVFTSETDAEVIAHLVSELYRGDLAEAVMLAYARLEGLFAFVAISAEEPDLLVGARRDCPLVVGRGEGEQFVASAVPAFLAHTRRVQQVENGEIVLLRSGGVTIQTASGAIVERAVETVDWSQDTAEKGGYETFMLKEIGEQADAVAETISERTAHAEGVRLAEPGVLDERLFEGVERIVIVACGTSYHAGLIGRYAIEEWARVPVEMDIASEYRYRNPVIKADDLVVGISQSGETADTLAAMRKANEGGARVLAITNVLGSQATREAGGVLFTRAGLEIGVAATKTFVCQVAAMYLLGLRLAELRGSLPEDRLGELLAGIKSLPRRIEEMIGTGSPAGAGTSLDGPIPERVKVIAREWAAANFFLYIGRHVGLPVALEGALKLKEISYIATDAYAAGEMKHGPIALLDESTPVVCVATDSPVTDKLASNMQEVRARGAHVIAITTAGNETIEEHADACIAIPRVDWMLQPVLAVIPLQLLAYEIARIRGLNVDQPRNLAKTVTVE